MSTTSPPSTTEAVHHQFLQLEDDHRLFELTADGVSLWERLRFDVNRRVMQNIGLIGAAQDSSPNSLMDQVSRTKSIGSAFTTKNPLFREPTEILSWGLPRRKFQEDGFWWDLYFDPLYQHISTDFLHLEEAYLGQHRTPARTAHIAHLDLVTIASMCGESFGRPRINLDQTVRTTLGEMEQSIQSQFGVSVDVTQFAKHHLRDRKIRKPLFSLLLDRLDPAVAVVVKSYGKETFIEACREYGIPTVEFQHGALSQYHYGYSYPGDREKDFFPDYFFAFGDHFRTLAEFPTRDRNVLSVGYPFLEAALERTNRAAEDNTVLFLSQGTVGKVLSKVAAELSEMQEVNADIVYKLHPTEQHRWRENYPWLLNADLTVVEGDSPTLYQLFSHAGAQVGVYSTALYEGLAFGLETYLVDTNRIEFVRDLVENGWASVVDSAEQIADNLAEPDRHSPESKSLFESNSLRNMKRELNRIMND